MKKLRNNYKGFTLIELMVVMSIIAVLATLIIGAITVARRTALETAHRSNAKTMQLALEAFFTTYKRYPNDVGNYSFEKISELGYTELSDGIKINKSGCDDKIPLHDVGGGGWIEFPAPPANTIKVKAYDYNCGSPIEELTITK